MTKKSILFLLLALLISLTAGAKKKKTVTPPAPEPPVSQGLFSVQKDKDKWFMLVPDSLLGRDFLAVTRYVSTPSGCGVYGGEEVNEQTLYWEKADDKLLLRSLVYLTVADSTQAIYRAIETSTANPIVEAFKIEATKKDSLGRKSYKIQIDKFINSDNQLLSLSESAKKRFSLTSLNTGRSYVKAINTYPINTEIHAVKTYGYKNSNPQQNSVVAGRETGAVTFEMNTSLVLLPEQPMRKRLFDPRVGYFADYYQPFADDQQAVKSVRYICRWRLEPKDEDIERMKRGELVEPKKQIVYYIDPATPAQWRPYLIQGVNDWNAAFEQAGFKNAIVAKEWPDDPSMSMEDARYSVIRYLASPISNAYGPNVHDPRSGEILESHVGWYHNVMKLLHDWYMIQAGCIDEQARSVKFDDELMGQLIRFVSSHEIGHTLGLRHNMGASSATPVDSLRDKAWVEAHGHTASIMDYARFNYVAQPEDGIGHDGIFPRIGDYDKWAISWGYRPIFDAEDENQERLILNKATIAQLQKSRRYWFGGEGNDNNPLAQTEDLGDNAMKASEYGLLNLKRIVKALPQWTYEEGDLNANLKDAFQNVVSQFIRYEGHVLRNIGGVYTTYKSIEEDGAVYTPQTKATQKEALDYLDRNVFTEPSWLIAEDYVARLSSSPLDLIKPIASYAARNMASGKLFANVARYAYGPDPYQPEAFITDLTARVFRETASGAKVSPYRRYLQREMVSNALTAYPKSKDDTRTYLYYFLSTVRTRLASAHNADAATRAHFANLQQMIRETLEK